MGILAGIVLGVIVGAFFYDPAWSVGQNESLHAQSGFLEITSFFGFTIFIGLLKMLIAPLIASSVILAIAGVGDFRQLGRMGSWTLAYYLLTMFIAVLTGITAVVLIEPGSWFQAGDLGALESFSQGAVAKTEQSAAGGIVGVFQNLVGLMIPENVFNALAEGKTLSLITFCCFFSVTLTMVGERGQPVFKFFESCYHVLMKMVELVLFLAPLGVFCLLAWSIARIGLQVFTEAIGVYMITVIAGLAVHAFITLPLILYLMTRVNPFSYLVKLKPALLTAIGTDSSIATLPATIECVTEGAGVSQQTAGLVLPLGANLNMDGTALYEAVAVVFIAQAFGVELGTGQLFVVAITATLAAVGAAGIPSAGLVTMIIVLEAVNQSLAAVPGASLIPAAGIGLIIGVDRIVDMLRTAVNVWGDAVGALLVDKLVVSD